MANVLNNYSYLSKVILAIQTVGNVFLRITSFGATVKRFVYGVFSDDEVQESEVAVFGAEIESLLHLCPALEEGEIASFRKFHNFTVDCGQLLGSVLVSKKEMCRKCNKPLKLDNKPHSILIYHSERGTYLGSQLNKFCYRCKIYEHYGFWTNGGKKYPSDECLQKDYLLSSEDTAFHMSVLRQCQSLLCCGAVPFSTFAASYNWRFGYVKGNRVAQDEFSSKGVKKRLKR